jgi:hypothetical protein
MRVTDAGMVRVQQLRDLEHLYRCTTHVGDAGVAELQKALPGRRIWRWSRIGGSSRKAA